MVHSGGTDSRVISGILTELDAERKSRIQFICLEPESALFRQVMAIEGWPEERIFTPQSAIPSFYRESVNDFEQAWRWANDATPFIPMQKSVVVKLQEQGRLPEDGSLITLIWGSFANELNERGETQLVRFLNNHYYRNYSAGFAMYSPFECLLPFVSLPVAAYSLGHPNTPNFRKKVLRCLSEELATIPPYDWFIPNPYLYLHDSIRRKAQNDYDHSWFGKTIARCAVPHSAAPHGEWVKYTAASLCEQLIRQGVTVRAENDAVHVWVWRGKKQLNTCKWRARGLAKRIQRLARWLAKGSGK